MSICVLLESPESHLDGTVPLASPQLAPPSPYSRPDPSSHLVASSHEYFYKEEHPAYSTVHLSLPFLSFLFLSTSLLANSSINCISTQLFPFSSLFSFFFPIFFSLLVGFLLASYSKQLTRFPFAKRLVLRLIRTGLTDPTLTLGSENKVQEQRAFQNNHIDELDATNAISLTTSPDHGFLLQHAVPGAEHRRLLRQHDQHSASHSHDDSSGIIVRALRGRPVDHATTYTHITPRSPQLRLILPRQRPSNPHSSFRSSRTTPCLFGRMESER